MVETDDGRVVAVDAKINFDDNAQFRQKEIFALDDTSGVDPREVSILGVFTDLYVSFTATAITIQNPTALLHPKSFYF